jgi:hypothetical protein
MEADRTDLDRLRALSARDVDDAAARQLARRAGAAFEREHSLLGRPWVLVGVRVWSRVMVPALLATTVGVYLLYAIQAASSLYR